MTSDHKDYIGLIPEYLNNTLGKKSRAEFEAALTVNPALAEEVEDFRDIKNLYREAVPEAGPPSDRVFERILSDIEVESISESTGFKKVAYRPLLSTRLVESFGRLIKSVTVPWSLALVQAAVIVLLIVTRVPENTYNTLGTTSQPLTAAEQIILNIVFDDSAREVDIRKLLLQVDGTIVAGPSIQGRYQISLAEEHVTDLMLEELKTFEFIRFVEKAD